MDDGRRAHRVCKLTFKKKNTQTTEKMKHDKHTYDRFVLAWVVKDALKKKYSKIVHWELYTFVSDVTLTRKSDTLCFDKENYVDFMM